MLNCVFSKDDTGVIYTQQYLSAVMPMQPTSASFYNQTLLPPFPLQGWTAFVKSNNLSLPAVFNGFLKTVEPPAVM